MRKSLTNGGEIVYLCKHFKNAPKKIDMSKMKLSEFSFDLPEELIAEYPADNRDEARLMVIHLKTGKI